MFPKLGMHTAGKYRFYRSSVTQAKKSKTLSFANENESAWARLMALKSFQAERA